MLGSALPAQAAPAELPQRLPAGTQSHSHTRGPEYQFISMFSAHPAHLQLQMKTVPEGCEAGLSACLQKHKATLTHTPDTSAAAQLGSLHAQHNAAPKSNLSLREAVTLAKS